MLLFWYAGIAHMFLKVSCLLRSMYGCAAKRGLPVPPPPAAVGAPGVAEGNRFAVGDAKGDAATVVDVAGGEAKGLAADAAKGDAAALNGVDTGAAGVWKGLVAAAGVANGFAAAGAAVANGLAGAAAGAAANGLAAAPNMVAAGVTWSRVGCRWTARACRHTRRGETGAGQRHTRRAAMAEAAQTPHEHTS